MRHPVEATSPVAQGCCEGATGRNGQNEWERLSSTDSLRKESDLDTSGSGYTPEQNERLRQIHARLIEARRELDALIGDAYLRPRASIVPVHFLDLASAAEKLRWAEKEWRELDREVSASAEGGGQMVPDEDSEESHQEGLMEVSGVGS